MQKTQLLAASHGLTAVGATLIWLTGAVLTATAIEEPPYNLETKEEAFEVRAYESQLVTEIVVEGALDAQFARSTGSLHLVIDRTASESA